jgi:hypothetical protein
MVKFNRKWVVNAIGLRESISNTGCPMLNNEVKTSAFEIQHSLFDINIQTHGAEVNSTWKLLSGVIQDRS